jgi:hypothetical protein
MRKLGYTAAVTEHWNGFAKIRQDLFGIVDVLCLCEGNTVAIQCTSGSNVASRVTKIAEHQNTAAIRKAGWKIFVHGWRKNAAGKWTLREIDCS